MRIIFLGKNKIYVHKSLRYLIKKKFEIVATAGFDNSYSNIPVFNDKELYLKKFSNIDLVISYLYPKKIKNKLIYDAKIGCINFHPAPLPDFRGVCGYSFGIFEGVKKWGVSSHFIDKNFDTGDIIEVKKFSINTNKETAFSLEKKSQIHLYRLFKKIINIILKGKNLPRKKQKKGRYFSMEKFERLRKINSTDSLEIIDKKIRACWFPPYPGAALSVKGKEFTLVNNDILKNYE